MLLAQPQPCPLKPGLEVALDVVCVCFAPDFCAPEMLPLTEPVLSYHWAFAYGIPCLCRTFSLPWPVSANSFQPSALDYCPSSFWPWSSE